MMGDHRLPKRVMSVEMENTGKCGLGRKEKEWKDCVAEDSRLFDITGDWSTAAPVPGVWYSTVHEGGYRFYGRVGEESGKKGARTPAEEERSGRLWRTRLRLHRG